MMRKEFIEFILSCPCKVCILRPICFQVIPKDSPFNGFDRQLETLNSVVNCWSFENWRKISMENFEKESCSCASCLTILFLKYEKTKGEINATPKM